MSSYAITTPIRLSMYEAKFFIYQHIPTKRKITIASKLNKNHWKICRYGIKKNKKK